MGDLYGPGARALQDRFDARRIADRLVEITVHDALWVSDQQFIERAPFFFLATVDEDGQPECSYKGGRPGFVRCVDDRTIVFPSYDGNGMFRSLGNVADTARVAMLFIDFEHPNRLRIHGQAALTDDPAILDGLDGAQVAVRVEVERAFPNCPRYIHRMNFEELSVYAPAPGHVPPEPEWKQMELFRDYLPGR